MINSVESYENSRMVATRDPPLDSRPTSKSQDCGSFGKPQNRHMPHRGFAVPKFEKLIENDPKSATKRMDVFNRKPKEKNNKKCCCLFCWFGQRIIDVLTFSCGQPRTWHLPSPSDNVVSNDTASSTPSAKFLSFSPSTNFAKHVSSHLLIKSDLGWGSSNIGVQVFNYAELQAAMNSFTRSSMLGGGRFGTIYSGVLPDGRAVAIKQFYNKKLLHKKPFMNEVEILSQLRHPNLVTLYGYTSSQSPELLLVYEYVPNGTVADHLHGKHAKSRLLSWPIRLSIAVETASALAYLHYSGIIHQDIKTYTIFLDIDFRAKVRFFPIGVPYVTNAPQGTTGYLDPEHHQCSQVTEKCDVFSFGMVLMELISSVHHPDISLSRMAKDKIQNGTFQDMVDANLGFETDCNVPWKITFVAKLAFKCLQNARDMRPSMEEVLESLKQIQRATCPHRWVTVLPCMTRSA